MGVTKFYTFYDQHPDGMKAVRVLEEAAAVPMRMLPLLYKHRIDEYPPAFFDSLSREQENSLDSLEDYVTDGVTGTELRRRGEAFFSLEIEGAILTNRVNLLLVLQDVMDEILNDDEKILKK